MADKEAQKGVGEATLVTDATQDFIAALNFIIGAGENISFRTVTNHRVSYIPARFSPLNNGDFPCLEINSSGIDAFFYARKVAGGKGEIEVVRTILLSGYSGAGESEIGIERLLSPNEKQVVAAIAMRPSATIRIKDEGKEEWREVGIAELMKLSLDEELALSTRQVELLVEARESERKVQAKEDPGNTGGILQHTVSVVRPVKSE